MNDRHDGIRLRSLIAARLAAVIAAAALVACAPPRLTEEIMLRPSANPWVSAIVMTRSWASATATIDYRTAVGSVQRQGTGVGALDLSEGSGDALWRTEGGEVRELLNDRGLFVQSQSPTAPWTRRDARTVTSGLLDPLAALGAATGVEAVGARTIDGELVDGLVARLPVSEETLSAFALDDDEIRQVVDQAEPADSISVTAWVNASGQIVRVERTLTLDGDAVATTSTALGDFGRMLDLGSPASAARGHTAG